jgi:hypothetical protein
MELRLKMRLVIVLTALLCGCAETSGRPDAEAARAHAAAVAEAEARAAVAVVGAEVCRRVTAGIGNYEWVSGKVTALEGEFVTVQIDKPGQLSHEVDGVVVVRGTKLKTRPELWTPCR